MVNNQKKEEKQTPVIEGEAVVLEERNGKAIPSWLWPVLVILAVSLVLTMVILANYLLQGNKEKSKTPLSNTKPVITKKDASEKNVIMTNLERQSDIFKSFAFLIND